jgi:hypothetical protein
MHQIGSKDLAPEIKHQKGQRTYVIKVDPGCRPAQLPVHDVPCRYDDDGFVGTGYWYRIDRDLDARLETMLSDEECMTFMERLHKLLDHYDKTNVKT